MARSPNSSPKRVVYLWGAGATQAEAQELGATTSLLMRDTDDFGDGLATRILGRMGSTVQSSFGSDQGVDIEKLISLLATSGVDEHTQLAEKMRRTYFTELKVSLVHTGVLEKPQLAIRLLRMHDDKKFSEEVETLSGIITTNHDGLLQIASQEVFGKVNLGFNFSSRTFKDGLSSAIPPILQLHGSFTWQFGRPIWVGRLGASSKYSDAVWIPPTILKESKNYPYNKLSGLTYELLARRCDVLRVVGASLTQNDWNILSLIFNAQRHREHTNELPFRIELIMPHESGEWIAKECAYIKNIIPIGYLTEGKFAAYKGLDEGQELDEYQDIDREPGMENPLAYWLSEKDNYHRSREELKVDDLDEAAA